MAARARRQLGGAALLSYTWRVEAHRGRLELGGLVLAGGRSTRMGEPKGALEWHGSTLLRHVAGLVARAVSGPVVVVRAPGQTLLPLPSWAEVVDDAEEGQGPLQGIAAGLAALDRCTAVFVSSSDCPFLHPVFVDRMFRALDDDQDAVLPYADGHPQPLAAVYRPSLRPDAEALLAGEEASPTLLLERARSVVLGERALLADPALAAADPELRSLLNLNEPEDYRAARAEPAPLVTVRERAGSSGRSVSAATLTAAAAAVGIALGATAIVNDEPLVPADPYYPLVAGDLIQLGS
jgi:molybdenum cofactor guanylyltransferase